MVAIIIASAVLGLGTALFYWIKVSSIPLTHGIENKEEAERLVKITRAIELGAMAFLKAEYKYMVYFMAGFAILIAFLICISTHILKILVNLMQKGFWVQQICLFGVQGNSR